MTLLKGSSRRKTLNEFVDDDDYSSTIEWEYDTVTGVLSFSVNDEYYFSLGHLGRVLRELDMIPGVNQKIRRELSPFQAALLRQTSSQARLFQSQQPREGA